MKHRKSSHKETVAKCKNWVSGLCPYTEESCWWNHLEKTQNSYNHNCYVCAKTFDTKNHMMLHRKKEHSGIVGLCKDVQDKNCKFSNERCWFKHEIELKNDSKNEKETEEMDTELVFRNVSDNLDPPLGESTNLKKN